MFTTVDFSKRYHYIELDGASSFLTTFNTPFCTFRVTRMLFGGTIAGDAFQSQLNTISNNLDFCTGIVNDIILDEKAYTSSHDKNLTEFLKITTKHNLK